MEPSHLECDINDVLDRLLNKGLALNADLIIMVAGIPLLGVNLRAAIAGMETMLEYGMMEAWDKNTREWYTREFAARMAAPLVKGEEAIIRTFGSIWSSQGIISAWKSGFLYLTSNRLFLWRKEPPETLFEVSLNKIEGLIVKKENHFGREREELYVQFDCGEVARIHVSDVTELERTIKMAVWKELENRIVIPSERMSVPKGEEIIREEKLWYLIPAQGILRETWGPGRLCLTNKRLFWIHGVDNQEMFEVPLDKVNGANLKAHVLASGIKAEDKVLDVAYEGGHGLFCGKVEKLYEMESAIQEIFLKPLVPSIVMKT
jgi:hypothetical protein